MLRIQVGPHSRVLQVLLELLPVQSPGVILIQFGEQRPHLSGEVVLPVKLILCDEVPVYNLGSTLKEDACQHIQNAKYNEDDVHYEGDQVPIRDDRDRLHNVSPVIASRNSLDQRHHALEERPIAVCNAVDVVDLSRVGADPCCGPLHEEDSKDVHDQEEKQESPRERGQGGYDGSGHAPEFVEDPEHSEDAEDTDHPEDAENTDEADICAIHDLLQQGDRNQEGVEDIPTPAASAEERQSQADNLDHELDPKQSRKGDAHEAEGGRRFCVRIFQNPMHAHFRLDSDHCCVDNDEGGEEVVEPVLLGKPCHAIVGRLRPSRHMFAASEGLGPSEGQALFNLLGHGGRPLVRGFVLQAFAPPQYPLGRAVLTGIFQVILFIVFQVT
mmetsp:Transcript_93649/g.200862  ORF Transcript_93649/g.200862 Transcript_93649/m.200862 type:complete len:385 (+) Transcript_93649:369-1523(+)